MAPPLIVRTPIIDDDLTGTTGTILNNAWKQELYDQIDADVALVAGSVVPYDPTAEVLTTGAAGNIALGAGYARHIVTLTPAGTIAITWSGGKAIDGETVTFLGRGAGVSTIAHGGTVFNHATSAPTPIAIGGSATYVRAGGNWYLTDHDQGAWIQSPFNAANFAGGGAMITTVTAVNAMRWRLSGRMLNLSMYFGGTNSGTLNASVLIKNGAWGGFNVSNQSIDTYACFPTGTNAIASRAVTAAAAVTLATADNSPYGANFVVQGSIGFEVD